MSESAENNHMDDQVNEGTAVEMGDDSMEKISPSKRIPPEPTEQRPFVLKKWYALAMWSWDVECDTCAICRVQLMDACMRCQAESKAGDDCVVVWGDCNHSFHNCCMALWVRENNRCPLCQQDWHVQRTGK